MMMDNIHFRDNLEYKNFHSIVFDKLNMVSDIISKFNYSLKIDEYLIQDNTKNSVIIYASIFYDSSKHGLKDKYDNFIINNTQEQLNCILVGSMTHIGFSLYDFFPDNNVFALQVFI